MFGSTVLCSHALRRRWQTTSSLAASGDAWGTTCKILYNDIMCIHMMQMLLMRPGPRTNSSHGYQQFAFLDLVWTSEPGLRYAIGQEEHRQRSTRRFLCSEPRVCPDLTFPRQRQPLSSSIRVAIYSLCESLFVSRRVHISVFFSCIAGARIAVTGGYGFVETAIVSVNESQLGDVHIIILDKTTKPAR